MAESREVSNTSMIAAAVAVVVGLGLLLGWYFFPNW